MNFVKSKLVADIFRVEYPSQLHWDMREAGICRGVDFKCRFLCESDGDVCECVCGHMCLRITECLLICIKLICISSDKLWEKIIQRTCLVTLIHIIFNKQSKFRESQHISKYSYFKCLQMPNVFTGFIYNIFRKKV